MTTPANAMITDQERADFQLALARFCACELNEHGDILGDCPGHREADNRDSRWLRRLTFIRREVLIQLQVEEMTYGKSVTVV